MSTIILMIGALACGVLSALTAESSKKNDWKQARMYSMITLSVAILTFLIVMFLITRSNSGSSEILLGVSLSKVLLVLSLFGTMVLSGLTLNESNNESSKAFSYAIGTSIMSFLVLLISVIMTIFFV